MRYRPARDDPRVRGGSAREPSDDETVRRHAEWCLALAEAAEPELSGERQADWFATLEAEHDNLRAALAYLDGDRRRRLQLRLTVALSRFWYVRGYLVGRRDGGSRRRLARSGRPTFRCFAARLPRPRALALLQGDYAAATTSRRSPRRRPPRRRAAIRRERAEQPRRDRPRRGRPRAGGRRARGGGGARAGGRRRAHRRTRDQQPRRPRAHDRRLRACPPAVRGEPRAPPGSRRHGEHRALALQPGRSTSCWDVETTARARFRESLALARDTGDKEDLAWCLEGLRRPRRAPRRQASALDAARCRRRAPRADGRRLQAVRATAPRGDRGTGASALRGRRSSPPRSRGVRR